ncbi:unnamed protein product, partial [Sphacelaria rigidula]
PSILRSCIVFPRLGVRACQLFSAHCSSVMDVVHFSLMLVDRLFEVILLEREPVSAAFFACVSVDLMTFSTFLFPHCTSACPTKTPRFSQSRLSLPRPLASYAYSSVSHHPVYATGSIRRPFHLNHNPVPAILEV